jgi:hypothetical protein
MNSVLVASVTGYIGEHKKKNDKKKQNHLSNGLSFVPVNPVYEETSCENSVSKGIFNLGNTPIVAEANTLLLSPSYI